MSDIIGHILRMKSSKTVSKLRETWRNLRLCCLRFHYETRHSIQFDPALVLKAFESSHFLTSPARFDFEFHFVNGLEFFFFLSLSSDWFIFVCTFEMMDSGAGDFLPTSDLQCWSVWNQRWFMQPAECRVQSNKLSFIAKSIPNFHLLLARFTCTLERWSFLSPRRPFLPSFHGGLWPRRLIEFHPPVKSIMSTC